jgi:hypothetical protein
VKILIVISILINSYFIIFDILLNKKICVVLRSNDNLMEDGCSISRMAKGLDAGLERTQSANWTEHDVQQSTQAVEQTVTSVQEQAPMELEEQPKTSNTM